VQPKKVTVLLIEDCADVAYSSCIALRTFGYKVIHRHTPKTIFSVLKKNKVDIILSNIMLPNIDGLALIKEVKANDEFCEIPFVFFTSISKDEVILDAMSLGAADYFIKGVMTPYDLPFLVEKVLKRGAIKVINPQNNLPIFYTILFIDDEERIANVFIPPLTESGYRVVYINNPEEIFSILKCYRVSLILCNMMMPNMNGFEVIQQIKSSADYANIPFVFLSSISSNKIISEGIKYGANKYIVKSECNPSALPSLLLELLHD
jgi:PleD family two-component response regulator